MANKHDSRSNNQSLVPLAIALIEFRLSDSNTVEITLEMSLPFPEDDEDERF